MTRCCSRRGALRHLAAPLALLLPALLLLLTLLLPAAHPAHAQSYSFAIPQMDMNVFVQPDASVLIAYDITFENQPGAHAIDIVDIGTPTTKYDLSSITAKMDGTPIDTSSAQASTYIDTGFELPLGAHSIPPGGRGTLHVEFRQRDMVYQDTTRGDYASLRITPTWFDSAATLDTSNVRVAVHALPGVTPDELLYQDENNPFTGKALFNERAVAYWEFNDVRATVPHMVEISFPQRGMNRVVKMSIFELFMRWYNGSIGAFLSNPVVSLLLALTATITIGIAIYRFTGGTGTCLLLAILAGVFFVSQVSSCIGVLAAPGGIALLLLADNYVKKHRRSNYLPPIVQVEGGGIARGLTAPEAAVLLEMPINKVLTLVMFGMLKKGLVVQTSDTPFNVEVAEDMRGDKDARRMAASTRGTVVHGYEHMFLDALLAAPGKAVPNIDFGKAMKRLIETVVERVKNFDLSDTRDYYRRIIDRAMDEAKAVDIGQPDERDRRIDRNFEWILLSDGYGDVMSHRGYRYRPMWTRTTIGSGGGTPGGIGVPGSGKGSGDVAGSTSLGDVAGSFVGWTENTMGRMAEAISPGSLQLPKAGSSGVVDLSGFDKVTGEFFEALGEASAKGGGGRSGGCACACAGCACACACAGGGR